MTSDLHLNLPCVPPKSTAQTKRLSFVKGGKPRFFPSQAHGAAISLLTTLLLPYAPEAPITGPVSLDVEIVWPHPKRIPKRHLQLKLPKPTTPDLDNWIKGVTDILVALRFIEDDAKVVSLSAAKFTGPEPGIIIIIAPIKEEQ